MPGYLIELDLRGRTAVVVGLGAVGRRKAKGLIEAGARVVGVDPGPAGGVPEGVERIAEAFRPDHLEGASLAFAAATPEVNRRVVVAAREAGVWVNAASEPSRGDFAVPAAWRSGPVALAVSTSGASPALARSLRDRAATAIGDAPALASLLLEMRPMALRRVADPGSRRRLLAAWGDARWLDDWARAGPESVRAAWIAMMDRLTEVDGTLHESSELS